MEKTWKDFVVFVSLLVLPALLFTVITIVENVTFDHYDQCPVGYFPCGNLSKCVPQSKQCDNVLDCPNGEDENYEHCLDRTALNMDSDKLLQFLACRQPFESAEFLLCLEAQIQNQQRCDLQFDRMPKGCSCYKSTRIKCEETLESFPKHIPTNVTKLFLQNTGLKSLPRNLSHLSDLKLLQLDNNYIKDIGSRIFIGTKNLTSLYFANNQLGVLKHHSFAGLVNLKYLFLQMNQITHIERGTFLPCKSLVVLNMSVNQLTLSAPHHLHLSSSVMQLDLAGNFIKHITRQSIRNPRNLRFLDLQNNSLATISKGAFGHMNELRQLNICCNSLQTLHNDIFSRTNQLHTLSLGQNPITNVKEDAFSRLQNLSTLNLTGITLHRISKLMFEKLTKLRFIYFERFEYCSYIPTVRVCEPRGDGISSVNNLLDLPVFRICIWVVAFFTCTGNIFVMILRLVLRDERNLHSLFIKNLCAADFTMGLYLLIVASHDVMFRDQYNKHAHAWMSSWCCQATGFLAMASCEVSILLVTFMSVERCIRISFPFKVYTFDTRRATISLVCIWSIGILLAVIPMFSEGGFGTFYGSNGVCFPLHIHDPFLPGWQYSIFVFVGVNFIAMILVSVCYVVMFISIRKSQRKTNSHINRDISFAKRFFLIVLTDAMCWIPIIVIKLLAIANISISNQFYAWLTIFVLPINSAINPIIYSVTTAAFRSKLQETFLKQRNSSGPSTLTSSSEKKSSESQTKPPLCLFFPRGHMIKPGAVVEASPEMEEKAQTKSLLANSVTATAEIAAVDKKTPSQLIPEVCNGVSSGEAIDTLL